MRNDDPIAKLLAAEPGKALRVGVGLATLAAGVAALLLLLFILSHAAIRFNALLIGFIVFVFLISIFCLLVAFRLLTNSTNRKGHLVPAWLYLALACALTASFFLGFLAQRGALPNIVRGVVSFTFVIWLCVLAYRSGKKPAKGYKEV